jgi:hypothetical protein
MHSKKLSLLRSQLLTTLILMLFLESVAQPDQRMQKTLYNCEDTLKTLRNEFDMGHYRNMDVTYNSFMKSVCEKDIEYRLKIIRLMYEQKLADGYRYQEAVVLRRRIDSLTTAKENQSKKDALDQIRDTIKFCPLRFGAEITLAWSNMGKPGFAAGINVGKRWIVEDSLDNDIMTSGIDLLLGYRRQPFMLNIIDNKENNNYKPDGYILNAMGDNYFFTGSILFSMNYEVTNKRKWGWGLYIGFGAQVQHKTDVSYFYHENDYSDSLIPNTNRHYLKFSEQPLATDKPFFQNKVVPDISAGLNIYYNPCKKLLLTLTPYTSWSFKELKLTSVDHAKRMNLSGLRLTISGLANEKEIYTYDPEKLKLWNFGL